MSLTDLAYTFECIVPRLNDSATHIKGHCYNKHQIGLFCRATLIIWQSPQLIPSCRRLCIHRVWIEFCTYFFDCFQQQFAILYSWMDGAHSHFIRSLTTTSAALSIRKDGDCTRGNWIHLAFYAYCTCAFDGGKRELLWIDWDKSLPMSLAWVGGCALRGVRDRRDIQAQFICEWWPSKGKCFDLQAIFMLFMWHVKQRNYQEALRDTCRYVNWTSFYSNLVVCLLIVFICMYIDMTYNWHKNEHKNEFLHI